MAKYGFSTTIPYGTDLFEVTGVEYCEWEDALEKVDSADDNAMQWVTYDVLMNNGYFVPQPKEPRPVPAKQKQGVGGGGGEQRRPGIRDTPNLITGDAREPVWTQSKILAERDKLLKEKEKILAIKEKALSQKIIEQQILEQAKLHERGSPSASDVFYTIAGVIIIVLALLVGAVLYIA